MKLSPAEKEIQENLSTHARALLEHVERHPRWLRRQTFEPLFTALREIAPNVPGLPRSEIYGIQPWPTLVDAGRDRRLETVCRKLAALIRDLPRRFFADDPRAVAEYYGLESEAMATLLLAAPNGFDAAVCRGDFIDTVDGPRCVEWNAGSVGGWQDSALAPPFLADPELTAFYAEQGIAPRHRNSVRAFLRHVVEDCRRAFPDEEETNVLIVAADEGLLAKEDHPRVVYRRELDAVLAEHGARGEIRVAATAEVEVAGGEARVGGKRFHGVFEQLDRITATSRALYRTFKAGGVRLYTGPITLILGDKRNLALLSKHRDSDLFDDDERELIAETIPWTRLVGPGRTVFRGDSVPIPELLRDARRDLVLKAGQSFGGKDVVVGRHADEETWRAAVSHALAEGGWVVQEYLEPLPYLFQHGEEGCAPHDVVWGAFLYGDRYGGTYLRLAPRGSGVINVSRGATVGLTFVVGDGEPGPVTADGDV